MRGGEILLHLRRKCCERLLFFFAWEIELRTVGCGKNRLPYSTKQEARRYCSRYTTATASLSQPLTETPQNYEMITITPVVRVPKKNTRDTDKSQSRKITRRYVRSHPQGDFGHIEPRMLLLDLMDSSTTSRQSRNETLAAIAVLVQVTTR